MREQHRRGVRCVAGLPAQRRFEPRGVDVQQYEVGSAGVQAVGGQMHLLSCREMDEADVAK
jgi:hypothetical protein